MYIHVVIQTFIFIFCNFLFQNIVYCTIGFSQTCAVTQLILYKMNVTKILSKDLMSFIKASLSELKR